MVGLSSIFLHELTCLTIDVCVFLYRMMLTFLCIHGSVQSIHFCQVVYSYYYVYTYSNFIWQLPTKFISLYNFFIIVDCPAIVVEYCSFVCDLIKRHTHGTILSLHTQTKFVQLTMATFDWSIVNLRRCAWILLLQLVNSGRYLQYNQPMYRMCSYQLSTGYGNRYISGHTSLGLWL